MKEGEPTTNYGRWVNQRWRNLTNQQKWCANKERKISWITLRQQQTLFSITRYSFYLQNTFKQKTRLAQRNKPISQQSTLSSKMTDWTYSINHPWQQNKSYLYSEGFRDITSLCSAFSCTVNLLLCNLSAYTPPGSPTYTMSHKIRTAEHFWSIF